MRTLVSRYLVWLAVVAGISLTLDGATRWIVAVLLLGVCFGNFVVDYGAVRDRARVQVPRRGRSSAPPSIAPEEPTPPSSDDPPEPVPPGWALCLLVDADQAAGTVRPTIQIAGPRAPELATVHLDVVDVDGDVRLTAERRFWYPDLGADVKLATFAVPAGASVDEVVRWDWQLTLCEGDEELARQFGPLTGAGSLNDEAELRLPVPQEPALHESTMDLETLLRHLASHIAAE